MLCRAFPSKYTVHKVEVEAAKNKAIVFLRK